MHYKKYKMFAIIFNNLKIFGSIDIVSFAVPISAVLKEL